MSAPIEMCDKNCDEKIINFAKFSKFSRTGFKTSELKFSAITYKWHNAQTQ